MKSRTLIILLGLFFLAAASWAQEPSARKLYTVRDTGKGIMVKVDREYGPYEEVTGTPYFQADGKNWGIILRRTDGRFSALVNGAEKGPFPAAYLSCSDISVSPDGTAWAMTAEIGGSSPERFIRVINGKEYGPFSFPSELTWAGADAQGQGRSEAAAGRSAGMPAGWAFMAESKGVRMTYTMDKKLGPFMDARDFCFDLTGTRLAFQYRNKDGVGVWFNGRQYGPFDECTILRGPDGSYFGFTDRLKNGSQEITIGEKKYGPYGYIDGRLYVSGDQTRWLLMVVKNNAASLLSNEGETPMERLEVVPLKEGFLYHRNKGPAQYVVTDKGEFGPYENLRDFIVVPDASSWGLSYWKGGGNSQTPWVVINGREYAGENLKHRPGADGYFSWAALADDGSAVYARLQNELVTRTLFTTEKSDTGITIFAGAKNLGPYERILGTPVVSTDGKNWGMLASRGNGMTAVIINMTETGAFGPYARVEGFTMNEAGTSWSFAAMKEDKAGAPRFRLLNGTEYGPFDVEVPPTYSPDGPGWFFWSVEKKGGPAWLYFNGKKLGPYTSHEEDKVYDFAKGKMALKEKTAEGAFVWINDRKYGPYREVQILRTGAERNMDSIAGLFGFVAFLKNGSQELYVDGDKTYGPYASVGQGRSYISRDGRTWLMGVRKQGADRDTLLMNGAEVDNDGFDVSALRGGWLLFIRRNGREYFTTNDRTFGPYEKIQSRFVSSDGGVWAGEAIKVRGNNRDSVIVANGKEYPGEKLRYISNAAGELFTWISYDQDGSAVMNTIQAR